MWQSLETVGLVPLKLKVFLINYDRWLHEKFLKNKSHFLQKYLLQYDSKVIISHVNIVWWLKLLVSLEHFWSDVIHISIKNLKQELCPITVVEAWIWWCFIMTSTYQCSNVFVLVIFGRLWFYFIIIFWITSWSLHFVAASLLAAGRRCSY